MNLSHVVGHDRENVSVRHVYYVSTDNILMWVCEM
jgi:hypothetical protein